MSSEHAPYSEIVAGNLFRSPDTCFQVNRHFGLLFGERLDTLFTSSDSKISRFTRPHDIGFDANLFFPLWRADLFFPDLLSHELAQGEGRDNYDGSYKIDTSLLLNISTCSL